MNNERKASKICAADAAPEQIQSAGRVFKRDRGFFVQDAARFRVAYSADEEEENEMKKARIRPAELLKLLASHDLQKYDICKICGVSAATAERYIKNGIPEAQFRLIKLSLGEM